LLAVILLAVTSAASCGGSDDDGESSATTETTTDGSTATTATTVAAEGPPEWVEVARDLMQRSFELRQDPDLDRLADLYAEGCDCWEQERETIQFLIDNGEHIEGRPAEVLFVRHELTDEETGLVNITVQARTSPMQRVDADGQVVQEIPAEDPSCVAYAILDDGPGGAWRIYSETGLPDCPEEAT
jgi:hypothetical protein